VDLVLATVRHPGSADVLAENWRVNRLLTQGVPVELRDYAGVLRDYRACLIDFEHPEHNDFVGLNQMSVEQDNKTRRPDVLAFVDGLPLGLIEPKCQDKNAQRFEVRGVRCARTPHIPALLAFTCECHLYSHPGTAWCAWR
jgi:type I site-specific restriction-modification system R (restriction) subunit